MTFVAATPKPERGRWRPILVGTGKLVLGLVALTLVLLSGLVILATLPGWPVLIGLTMLALALAALWWLSRRATLVLGRPADARGRLGGGHPARNGHARPR